jgi:hypothetical protein
MDGGSPVRKREATRSKESHQKGPRRAPRALAFRRQVPYPVHPLSAAAHGGAVQLAFRRRAPRSIHPLNLAVRPAGRAFREFDLCPHGAI